VPLGLAKISFKPWLTWSADIQRLTVLLLALRLEKNRQRKERWLQGQGRRRCTLFLRQVLPRASEPWVPLLSQEALPAQQSSQIQVFPCDLFFFIHFQ